MAPEHAEHHESSPGEARRAGGVAAVVVVWRELGVTVRAIQSVLASSVEVDPLICVAQQLPKGQLAQLKDAAGGHLVVALDDNIGFAAAVNLAIDRARSEGAEWALVLNNDATVSTDCIERCLLEAKRFDRLAVVGPAVAYAGSDRLWFAGARHSRWLGLTWHQHHFARAGRPPPSSASDYVPGCCALVNLEAWSAVGGLREDFFMYHEDADWGERARARGWQVRYLGEVLCSHVMAASSGQAGSRYLTETTAYYLARNPLRHALDTTGIVRRVLRTGGVLTIWSAYNATRIRPRDWSTVGRACVRGVIDAIRNRMGPRPIAPAVTRCTA